MGEFALGCSSVQPLDFVEVYSIKPAGQSGADPGGGGSWGADDPPFSLKMMASFRKIEPFSLAKLQFFKYFQVIAASCIVISPQKFQI